MKLPGGAQAIVDVSKLRNYCLSTSHVRGRHKARVFASILGLTEGDAEVLARELRKAASEAEAIAGDIDDYGARYTIDCELVRGNRSALVRSSWIILRAETIPRLTSCDVLLK